eukprot:XP_762749.1 hypothetical protein [Theileria parva strain Muguga]
MNLDFDNFDYYDTLNVTPNSSQDEIKTSYRKLIRLWHPDKNSLISEPDSSDYTSDQNHQALKDTQSFSNDGQSLNKKRDSAFTKIQKAYSVLSDPILRSHYGNLPPIYSLITFIVFYYIYSIFFVNYSTFTVSYNITLYYTIIPLFYL